MTKKILFIGDVHGKWDQYARILEIYHPEHSVQVGDFGIGFANEEPEHLEQVRYAMDNFGSDNRYIRGNHDNPQACADDPRWIPDATYDEETGIFYLGGALSIDRAWRIEGSTWWANEELSYDALFQAIDLYEQAKPRIVVSHEVPESVVHLFFNWYQKEQFTSRTRHALDSMRTIHEPEIHIFGHWHHSVDQVVGKTRFVCLNELEAKMITL